MKKILFVVLGTALLAACGNKNKDDVASLPLSQKALNDSINMLDSLMYTDIQFDTIKSNKMIGWCLEYASRFSEDSLAPVYMQKAAMIQMNNGDFEQAVATLDSIIELYPGFENVADCHFLKGQAYEQNQQYDLARKTYTDFVNEYPDHVLASDIRKTLDRSMVGMTPEEQLKVAIAHNKKTSKK